MNKIPELGIANVSCIDCPAAFSLTPECGSMILHYCPVCGSGNISVEIILPKKRKKSNKKQMLQQPNRWV